MGDLFDQDNIGWLQGLALLDRLVAETCAASAEAFNTQSWE
jgi:hypothetical protein